MTSEDIGGRGIGAGDLERSGHRERDSATESPLTTGELINRLSEDVTQLVRDELRLAQVEVTDKAKKAGLGVGLFSAAGVLALYGFGVLIATAVLALAVALPGWLSALIVAVVLFAGAAIAALVGKEQVSAATPPLPTRTVENVKQDVDAVRHPRDH